MRFLIIFLLFIFTIISAALTTFPFMLLLLLNIAVFTKKTWIFAASFLTGLTLDILYFDILGKTSLFFTLFILVVILYERKFETQTYPFIFIFSFLGSLVYLTLFGSPSIVIQSMFAPFTGIIFFYFFKKFTISEENLHRNKTFL